MSNTTRVKITQAAFEKSKAGNSMVHITLDAGGEKINHYITNLPDKKELTTKLLNQFFDAFEIERKDFKFDQWVGKEADAVLVDDEWNGRTYKKVKFFVVKKFVPSPQIQKVLERVERVSPHIEHKDPEPEKEPEQEVEPIVFLDEEKPELKPEEEEYPEWVFDAGLKEAGVL